MPRPRSTTWSAQPEETSGSRAKGAQPHRPNAKSRPEAFNNPTNPQSAQAAAMRNAAPATRNAGRPAGGNLRFPRRRRAPPRPNAKSRPEAFNKPTNPQSAQAAPMRKAAPKRSIIQRIRKAHKPPQCQTPRPRPATRGAQPEETSGYRAEGAQPPAPTRKTAPSRLTIQRNARFPPTHDIIIPSR